MKFTCAKTNKLAELVEFKVGNKIFSATRYIEEDFTDYLNASFYGIDYGQENTFSTIKKFFS